MNIKKDSDNSAIDFRQLFKYYVGRSESKPTKSKEKDKFGVYQFDHETYVVFDRIKQREICVCSNYVDIEDAKPRAEKIAALLNASG